MPFAKIMLCFKVFYDKNAYKNNKMGDSSSF
jgi:hypothetical protein